MTVLEKAERLREGGTSLALFANAWKALDGLSIGEELRPDHPPCIESFSLSSFGRYFSYQNIVFHLEERPISYRSFNRSQKRYGNARRHEKDVA